MEGPFVVVVDLADSSDYGSVTSVSSNDFDNVFLTIGFSAWQRGAE